MIQLREYQQSAVSNLIPDSFRKGHKRIIRCAPTGSGKSLEMAEMTRLAYEKGKRVLLLTHRKELFKSTLAHIGKASIPCAELVAGNNIPMGDWRVMMAMEKTLWNRLQKQPENILRPDLIIVDEGHFNNFTKIINHFSDSFVITFTATPEGKHISKLYTDIIDNIGIPELIEQNYLTPCKPYMMQDKEGFDKVKINKGEFDSNELFKHYNTATRYKGVLDEYFAKVKGQKGIIFCVNVEHTIKTYEVFKGDGVNAFLCHSNISESERDYNIREFESSSDGVMINCGILTTGYSHDPIMFGIIDRATTSLPLWLQMQGRCSRIYPNKKYFTILDFGDNHTRLGLWNQKREWSLIEKKKNKKAQPMAVKNCPNCGAMLPARVMLCEFCQHVFEKPDTELKDGVMVLFESNTPISAKGKRISELSVQQLCECQTTKKISSFAAYRIARTNGEHFLTEYCKAKNYSNGFLWRQRQLMQDKKEIGYKDKVII